MSEHYGFDARGYDSEALADSPAFPSRANVPTDTGAAPEMTAARSKPSPGSDAYDQYLELRTGRVDPKTFDAAVRPIVEQLVTAHGQGRNADVWRLAEEAVFAAEEFKAKHGKPARTPNPSDTNASTVAQAKDGSWMLAEDIEEHDAMINLAADIYRQQY
jgi:hypothetical protein